MSTGCKGHIHFDTAKEARKHLDKMMLFQAQAGELHVGLCGWCGRHTIKRGTPEAKPKER